MPLIALTELTQETSATQNIAYITKSARQTPGRSRHLTWSTPTQQQKPRPKPRLPKKP